MPNFRLIPPKSKLQDLAVGFGKEDSEEKAFEAGRAIANGSRSLENLLDIVRWKSARSEWHIRKNTSSQITNALDAAATVASSNSDENLVEALNALQKLKGVGIPVASAILTAINPERYTIIDFRALEALDYPRQDENFYIAYLNYCRDLAAQNVVSAQTELPAPTPLRALDRALWQWSYEQSNK